jgi:hypothetical protein
MKSMKKWITPVRVLLRATFRLHFWHFALFIFSASVM